jgi:GTPase involved in cell partitioning and DNA repair
LRWLSCLRLLRGFPHSLLSHVQTKIGDYAFTTLRPAAALTRISGVFIQLVEIPGLISGAAGSRGESRALLDVLRDADAMVYCLDVRGPYDMPQDVRNEIAFAGIDLPSMLAATKMDEANEEDLAAVQAAVLDLPVVGVSIIDDESLVAFKEAVWKLTGFDPCLPASQQTSGRGTTGNGARSNLSWCSHLGSIGTL